VIAGHALEKLPLLPSQDEVLDTKGVMAASEPDEGEQAAAVRTAGSHPHTR